MIRAICEVVSIPIIVGGGIRTPGEAAAKVKAGASFVVTGNILEKKEKEHLIQSFVDAIHTCPAEGMSS
jgi:phosphoglycerol geranylgeranyltransferase